MNELLFFFHIALVVAFSLFALRRGLGAIVAWISLQGILANLFVLKQISLFGLFVTCSDVFMVGQILSLNLAQEYFGKKEAKLASAISLFLLVFFVALAKIHLLYDPAPVDTAQGAFLTIFSPQIRIVAASIATLFIVQQADLRLFPLLKGPLPVRVALSLVSSQALDTVLFSFLGLYGLVESVWSIAILSFCIKCIAIAMAAPFVSLSKRMVKDVPV